MKEKEKKPICVFFDEWIYAPTDDFCMKTRKSCMGWRLCLEITVSCLGDERVGH